MIKTVLRYMFKIPIAIFIIIMVSYSCFISSDMNVSRSASLCFYSGSLFVVICTIYGLIRHFGIRKFLLIFLFYIVFINLPPINHVFDQDTCLDTSICAEGLEINTEYGLIKVNKENCLKYNWKWDEKSKTCNMKD